MENNYNIFIDRNGYSVIEKEKNYMTISDLHTIFAKLTEQGKGRYCVHFEAWSSTIGEITIDDKNEQICLD